MRLYRVLLILLVILMGCSQQASKEKAGKKTGTTKTGNKRKQKGIKQNKLDEKPVDDETSDNNTGVAGEIKDNNTGEEGNSGDGGGKADETKDNTTGEEANLGDGGEATLYATLEKKVKELREEHERAKNKFKEAGHPFPNKEERSRLFPNSQESKRAERAFMAKQYSFFNIVNLMRSQGSYKYPDIRSQGNHRYPDRMDDFYAGLEYDAGFLTELDKIIPKLNHEELNYGSSEASSFYHHFLNRIGEVGEYNRKVLYEYLSDEKLAKLKRGNDADIEKANELLDEFMKKKADLLGLIKTQIKEVENYKKRNDFYIKVIEARRDEIVDAYHDWEKSRRNIKEFCSKLNI
ncbi:hypothetical protein DB313_04920 (plasmid) [Borrelia turcica IST7]|uniref:Uncharacterized protein n=1 Tax=Borrelia turcica IST7 TaxID=1104446 RepID=A0A386PPC9_9SPIR|nr:hypothetical protein [Borrelia turcica]AYE36843.1 hypothetical protein DB313_04920 [Borrelia turcica IST7]